MLNVSTNEKRQRGIKKAKRIKRRKIFKSVKQYALLFILAGIYYLGVYGFSFKLSNVSMGDFMLLGFILIGFLLQIVISVLSMGFSALKRLIFNQVKPFQRDLLNAKMVSVQFSDLIKKGNMGRVEILAFKEQIDKLLPKSQVKYYSKNCQFANEAHEIYTKLKNSNLKTEDHKQLLNTLNQFQAKKKQSVKAKTIVTYPQTAKVINIVDYQTI